MATQPPFLGLVNHADDAAAVISSGQSANESNLLSRWVAVAMTVSPAADTTIDIHWGGAAKSITGIILYNFDTSGATSPTVQVLLHDHETYGSGSDLKDSGAVAVPAYAIASAFGSLGAYVQYVYTWTTTSGGVEIPDTTAGVKSVRIVLTSAPDFAWSAGYAWIGEYQTLSTSSVIGFEEPPSVVSRGKVTMSSGGGPAGQPLDSLLETSMKAKRLTAADKLTLMDVLGAVGTSRPFVLLRTPGLATQRDTLLEGGIVSSTSRTVSFTAVAPQVGTSADFYQMSALQYRPWR